MAVAKNSKIQKIKNSKQCEACGCSCNSKWANVGWSLLLVGGLSHMLPTQMAPLLKWGIYDITLQMAIGVVSVVLALYFLLGNE
ncbi:MAG: hypothetical protein UU93_C0005G0012 [Candidatus Amesbacteria bacterium GW2011_GWA2_42_12]|uniref:Uncharacterized protein n=1 Tax=Candidatus Amesbacteria bacterium GW2011_GWA2_42_12 TaxID=1618356 RepID=A0A0G0Y7L6_9BACT|nr:MAG: hypothetical protein UU93_C0005G0012 [Candidatus Amesbacteria bacterium GW2011_GWA2_42_12]